jgi:hypothetical protein
MGLGYLCLHLKITLFNLPKLYIYIKYIFSPYKTIIRNALKRGKPNRKPYHLAMVSEIYTKKSTNEKNSSLFMKSIL